MATYTLISSNVLTSSAASVTFSAIPATYTDLVLRTSMRTANAGTFDDLYLTLNGSSSNYSRTRILGNGTAATSDLTSSASSITNANSINGNTSTADSFSSFEIYIPSYTVSQNKPSSLVYAMETNATSARLGALANLWSDVSAITSITFAANASFLSTSSFYLYGISSS